MAPRTIEVWDWPVRLFHWLLLALVVGSVVSVKIGGGAMVWHGRFGQAILGLVVFRIVWGLIGSRTARFASFVRGPRAIADYLAGRWRGVGHNPLGALSVLAMLAVIGFQAATGLFAFMLSYAEFMFAMVLSGDASARTAQPPRAGPGRDRRLRGVSPDPGVVVGRAARLAT